MDMVAANDMEYLLGKLDEVEDPGCALGIEEQLQELRRAAGDAGQQGHDLSWANAGQRYWKMYAELRKANDEAGGLLEEIWCWYERRRSASSAKAAAVTRFFDKVAFRGAVVSRLKELISKYQRTLQESTKPQVGVPFSFGRRVTEPSALLGRITDNFGREDDVERIVVRMREASDDLLPHIIPVVGMPLMGKTAIVHMVYEHPWVKERFDQRIWVHVSPLFDHRRVLRIMANNLHNWKNWYALHDDEDSVQDFVREQLRGKRYFLVLDDVWNEDENKWNALKQQLLPLGVHGSTVIITTRSHGAAEMMAVNSVRPYELKGLSAEGCWQMFARLLKDWNFELLQELREEEQGHGIVRYLLERCSGVPIAVRLVAADVEHTRQRAAEIGPVRVLTDDGLKHDYLLSYEHFPINLRNCFKFCSLFLEDHNYDMEEFGEIWLAERYASASILNQVAKVPHPEITHFSKLWKECFFQNYEASSGKFTFKMHNLMHELALLCKDSGLYELLRADMEAESIGNPEGRLHLSLLVDSETKMFPRVMLSMKKLKTLILLRETDMVLSGSRCKISEIPSGLFSKLKNLCVLDLQYTMIKKLPHTIANLRNLRYLNLSETDIAFVPRFVAKLQSLMYLKLVNCRHLRKLNDALAALVNLQKLDLAGCHCLVKVPERIDNIRKLRCLNVQDCPSLVQMPFGISDLTNLITLPRYIVGETEGRAISELQNLVGLGGDLRLENLENVPRGDNAATANLQHKTMLKSLTFQWKINHAEEEKDNVKFQDVLEELRPNKELTKLVIISYMGKQFPSWMTESVQCFASLEEIKLLNLKVCQALPPLGLLPCLRVAELSGMDAITVVDDALYGPNGTFPCLQKLTFSQMLNLEKWLDVDRRNMFPQLTNLTFIHCPKLVALEMELPFVRELSMWLNNEGLCSSPGGLNGLRRSLKKLSISLCEHLLESSECKGIQELQALEELEISGCQELTNLPKGVRQLNSIKSLTIACCNKLTALPIWLSDELTSLSSLTVSGCNQLQSVPEGLRCRPKLCMSLEA